MELIIAILGSTTLSTIITTIIAAIKDNNGWKDKISKLEKDSVRTQLMLLMTDYPDQKQEILTVAEYYFDKLHGNWYTTTLFENWLEQNDIPNPIWFKGGQNA